MERPIAGVSALIMGAAAIGFGLTGCSAAPRDVVIGLPSVSTPVASAPVSLDNAINEAIANELAQVSVSQSVATESASVAADLNALTSAGSLNRSELIAALVATSAKQIAKREGVVASLIADVRSDKYLNGVDPAGRSLGQSLIAILDGVNAQLQALSDRIASDQLADQLRSDVLSIGPSTRVYGVFVPMTHLAVAAGDELYELNALANQEQPLASQVAAHAASDPNHQRELATLNDLSASITAARRTAGNAAEAVMAMTPSEYPANKSTIVAARSALVQLRSPLGRLGEANGDVNVLLALLSNA